MKIEKKFIIIGILFITIVNIYALFQSNLAEKENLKKIKEEAEIIKKEIEKEIKNKKEKNYYYIENNKILKIEDSNKKVIKKLDHFDGEGTVFTSDRKILEFQIQMDENCVTLKNDKIAIKKENCSSVGKEESIATKIQNTALKKELVEDNSETAKDLNLPFASKKYYVGEDPNNYLIFKNSCYRIINIANNDTVKVIYEGATNVFGNCSNVAQNNSGFVALLEWNNNKKAKITWVDSSLNYSLQRFADDEKIDMVNIVVKLDKEKIEDATWYTGEVTRNSDTLKEVILDERTLSTTEESSMHRKTKLGLINVSDYLKISCKSGMKNQNDDCSKNNYLYKSKYDYWTISSINDKTNEAWQVTVSGDLESLTIPYSREFSYSGIRPVMYIKSDVKVTGTGTGYNPYKILDK